MTLLSWAAVGLVAGAVARLLAGRLGLLEDLIVGCVGSVVGGWLFTIATGTPITRFDPLALAFALIGGSLFLIAARGITGGRTAI